MDSIHFDIGIAMTENIKPEISGTVQVNGDDIYFEIWGTSGKPPILMIPPAGGDGWQYARLAHLLSASFRVITYDRRANGRSTAHHWQNFSISQQSDDASAVLKAAGENTSYIFGNSSGAVIALDLAARYPQLIRKVIAHEAPIPAMLPDRDRWTRFFGRVVKSSNYIGASWASLVFMLGSQLPVTGLIGASRFVTEHKRSSTVPYIDAHLSAEVLIKAELLPVTNFHPELDRLRDLSGKVVIGLSEWALKMNTWYIQANQNLAKALAVKPVVFPGHHGSFMDMPGEWAARLTDLFCDDSQFNSVS